MMRRWGRGVRAGTWSGAALLVAVALAGPAVAGSPALAATSTPAAGPAVAQPPIPLPPGLGLRERAKQSKQRMDDRRGQVPDAVAAWGMDEGTGKVVVDVVGRDAPAALGFLTLAGADPTAVTVRTDAPRIRPFYDLVGGEAIYSSSSRCSLGFNTRSKLTGKRYVLTAGHCTKGSSSWSGYNRVTIGPVAATRYPTDDYGAFAVNNSAWTATAKVRGGPTVKGSTAAGLGGSVCRSGSTTGYRCGTVQAFNQTVNYGGGNVVLGLTRTSACAEPGDSGGSFVTPAGQAQGLTSGGSGNCSSGGTTYFQPLNEILQTYALALTTG